MKPRPVTKLDERNTATSNKIDDGIMWGNCDVNVIFPIYGQFGAIRKLDFAWMVYLTYILHLSYKTESRTNKISNTVLILLFWVKVLFLRENAIFLQKNADISKIKGVLVPKDVFSETIYAYLSTKLLVFSIILTSFRQGTYFTPHPSQNKLLKSPT